MDVTVEFTSMSKTFSMAGWRMGFAVGNERIIACLLYTSDAADERSSVDLGGRRIIKKKKESTVSSDCARGDEYKMTTSEMSALLNINCTKA